MKAQRQKVKVDEDIVGEPAHRIHGNGGEDRIARLGQGRHRDPQQAVEQGQRQRPGDEAEYMMRGGMADQPVGRPFERIRYGDGDELADQQQSEGREHPP